MRSRTLRREETVGSGSCGMLRTGVGIGGGHARRSPEHRQLRPRSISLASAVSSDGGEGQGLGKGLPPQGGAREEPGEDEWLDSDWEEEDLDDLFEKYGETIIKNEDEGATRQREESDDVESEAFALAVAAAANEVKGVDILVLHVKPLVYWTCYFVIVTAFSKPQIDAIGSRMRDVAEQKFQKKANGGDRQAPNAWTLLDFGDVVVHLFMPKERAFYNLEEFYANAVALDLPFETRTAP